MTNHEKTLAAMQKAVSDAKFMAENASWSTGEDRRKEADHAADDLRAYEKDESAHDHTEAAPKPVTAPDAPHISAALILAPEASLVALEAAFQSDDEIDAIISAAAEKFKAEAEQFDVSTKKGRAGIASAAHKVSRLKTNLDKSGKGLTAKRREEISAVNDGRNKIKSALDILRDEIRKPVTEWETAEAVRIAQLEAAISEITTGGLTNLSPSADIADQIAKITLVELSEEIWEEYLEGAAVSRSCALDALYQMKGQAESREAREDELERLHVEEDERQRIEAEKAELERAEAERLAEIERKRSEVERIEREKAEAVENAKKEAEAKAKADLAAAEQKRIADIEAAKEQERTYAKAKADKLEADLKSAEYKRAADAASAKEKADREDLERTKAHNARQFRAKARMQLAGIFESLTQVELIDAIMADEIALLRFIPEAVK